jgi:hypothetical protein
MALLEGRPNALAALARDRVLRDLGASLTRLRDHGTEVTDVGPHNVGCTPDGSVVLFDAAVAHGTPDDAFRRARRPR